MKSTHKELEKAWQKFRTQIWNQTAAHSCWQVAEQVGQQVDEQVRNQVSAQVQARIREDVDEKHT